MFNKVLKPLLVFVSLFNLCLESKASGFAGPSDSVSTRLRISNKLSIAPYDAVSGGDFVGKAVSSSPDPLVSYVWERETDGLQVYELRPIDALSETGSGFENIASALTDHCHIKVNGTGSLRFDFGVESAAWIEFDSPDLDGEVEMSISEYNKPAVVNSGPQSPQKTAVPVRHGNTYRLELNAALYEGVRFGWIHVKSVGKPWQITDVRLVCQTKKINYRGHFESSDSLLNRIWYTGAYGVKLNLLEDHIGAILIDRGDRHSWTGDAYISQGVSMVAFGNYDMVKSNLERTAEDHNSIESYSLLWIHSLLDYYRYTGDEAYFRAHFPTIKRKMDHAKTVCEQKKNLGFYGWDERIGAGFEDPNNPESHLAFRMLYIQTGMELSSVLADLGEYAMGDTYKQLATSNLRQLRSDSLWFDQLGLHAAADAINGNYLTNHEATVLVNRHFYDTINTVSFSPFNQYFIIRAMAKTGHHREALATVDKTWGGQLRLGATTFWECFRPEWLELVNANDPVPNGQHGYTSLCHPWSSGVTRWLSEEILGIKPLTPGFKRFTVLPRLSATVHAVRGDVPTPNGTISFALDANQGDASLNVPTGSTAVLGIPKTGRRIQRISTNGQPVYPQRTSGIRHTEDDSFVYFHDLPSGRHIFTMEYGDSTTGSQTPSVAHSSSSRSVSLLGIDSTAGPQWRLRYGSAGHLTFEHHDGHVEQPNLPPYITGVHWKKEGLGLPRLATWQYSESEKFPFLATRNPNACQQTFYVDILAQPEKDYRFTLRTAELANEGKFVIDVFDQKSKNLIHPTVLVQTLGRVQYYTFRAKGAVRVRLSHLEGPDAAISGIFFQDIAQP